MGTLVGRVISRCRPSIQHVSLSGGKAINPRGLGTESPSEEMRADPPRRVRICSRFRWPDFCCPPLAGFGCPPRLGNERLRRAFGADDGKPTRTPAAWMIMPAHSLL